MIVELAESGSTVAGGKARGLALLLNLGLKVPEGFVLIPDNDNWREELDTYLDAHSFTAMAVRSSGLFEDGENISFAGQFETYLNCRTKEEILHAVDKCHGSVNLERAGNYREHFHLDKAKVFPVVIQEMVKARRSGAIFTANPVNNRTDQWMVSVTEGIGEKLMSGTVTGEQILLSRNGRILQKGKLLTDDEIIRIFKEARSVKELMGHPVDLEWAIDDRGDLYWLQARPVTTLKKIHLNELDGNLFSDNEVFTRANIGEMMPGPVTPLTYSVFGRAIELGLQDFYMTSGALKSITNEWIYFRMFYYHLFFSMSRMAEIGDAVLSNRKEDVEFAIMGQTLNSEYEGYHEVKHKAFPVRFWNLVKQIRYFTRGAQRMRQIRRLADTFKMDTSGEPNELYRKLDNSLSVLNRAYTYHYCTSSQSGTYQTALLGILSGGRGIPTNENYNDAAALMSELREVESAEIVKSIDRIYEQFKGSAEINEWLEKGTAKEDSEIVTEFQKEINSLLLKQGHRCVRESELREKSWAEEPEQLINLIRRRFISGERNGTARESYQKRRQQILDKMGWFKRRILILVIKLARPAVARREYTKSMAVKIQQEIKKGYQTLAVKMTDQGLLDDTDQVFFLTHEELGNYINDGDKGWKSIAEDRRNIFPEAFSLKFPDICQGYPEPLSANDPGIKINGNAIKGLPVSTGSVQARVRIIEKLEDARLLEKGEIMICQYTDVGWTPYFSLAEGLITEIGSPLSHGAVVAREYGIPAVVNVKGAMGFFKSGETVLLDGATGIIRRIN